MKIASVALISGLVGGVFALPPLPAEAAAYKEIVLHSFGSGTDGQHPSALIDVNGKLYGTTSGGGTGSGCSVYGCGTVFMIDRKTRIETVLYSFCTQKNCADGESPSSSLLNVKGTLYGTTFLGGSGFGGKGEGTAFSLDPITGAEKVLYSFCSQQNCPDGANPEGGLISVRGVLYGTTSDGDTGYEGEGLGTAFKLDPSSGYEDVLYSFCQDRTCSDGQNPNAALIDINGMLFGAALGGGAYDCGNGHGCGIVFSVNTGAETVVHSFGNADDGRLPQASLTAVNGLLYGTTYGGGVTGCADDLGCGTVYSVDPDTGDEKVIYSFCSKANCADGANPSAALIDVNGILYGTTSAGGSTRCNNRGCGTVFGIDPNTGKEKVLHVFGAGSDGANPQAGLIEVKGTLYGTTEAGGAYGFGSVFALRKAR